MEQSVRRYFQSGLAITTQRTYSSGAQRFLRFCESHSVHCPFPVSEKLLCCFAAWLADEKLCSTTIKTYLAAVRSMQISLGLPDPRDQSSMPMLKQVQAGIQRLQGHDQTVKRRIRLPITTAIWRNFVNIGISV